MLGGGLTEEAELHPAWFQAQVSPYCDDRKMSPSEGTGVCAFSSVSFNLLSGSASSDESINYYVQTSSFLKTVESVVNELYL